MSYQSYRIREDTVFEENKTCRLAFGIDIISPNGETICSFSDLFCDRKQGEKFVALCNEGELSLAHILDVLEDFMGTKKFF